MSRTISVAQRETMFELPAAWSQRACGTGRKRHGPICAVVSFRSVFTASGTRGENANHERLQTEGGLSRPLPRLVHATHKATQNPSHDLQMA
jgi:hypothetical protein